MKLRFYILHLSDCVIVTHKGSKLQKCNIQTNHRNLRLRTTKFGLKVAVVATLHVVDQQREVDINWKQQPVVCQKKNLKEEEEEEEIKPE